MLPISFHKSFIPERQLLAEMLSFAAEEKCGNFNFISQETGIPMGRETGKVQPILNYARGMGLISLNNQANSATKRPVLTPFGRVVYEEDVFMSEPLTQWIAHINLCRSDIGAKVWHEVFAHSKKTLGISFSKHELEDYLTGRFDAGSKRAGPVVGAYKDEAALGRSGVLTVNDEQITRNKAPIIDYFTLPYSAVILSLLESFFSEHVQVTVTDFNEKTNWFDVCLWNDVDVENVFAMIERKQFISFDRQMKPWIIEKRATADEVWPLIYDELA